MWSGSDSQEVGSLIFLALLVLLLLIGAVVALVIGFGWSVLFWPALFIALYVAIVILDK